MTLRGAGDWTDTTLTVDDGSTHERVLGDSSRWCDLTGTPAGVSDGAAAGAVVAGLAFLDHPGNRRHPVPWYASTRADTYGDEGWSNFLNAAFLWDSALTVPALEPLSFRYRAVVHDGAWSTARCTSEWERWRG